MRKIGREGDGEGEGEEEGKNKGKDGVKRKASIVSKRLSSYF